MVELIQKKRCAAPWLVSLLLTGMLFGCVRPDSGPSPFEALAREKQEQVELPSAPVLGPSHLILPDTDLVYGPSTADFSFTGLMVGARPLSGYSELVDERSLSGEEILEKISREYSINPRLLLALLEFSEAWADSGAAPLSDFPFIADDPARKGLFRQLAWAANELNRGFYSRRVGGLERFATRDGVEIITSPDVNEATAALQYVLGRMLPYQAWLTAVGPLGISARYHALFGRPEVTAYSIPIAEGIRQPELNLPFTEGEGWFFTSGPHSAWGNGAAWAALDFAPDEENYGCYAAEAWVTAVADGLILRSMDGAVVQDLDGDGLEGTGWTILYMHIAERERAAAGAFIRAGERIGHPSCEGGPATGSHLHLARRFNGEWIPADQDAPFNLSGWISSGAGVEYDGALVRGDQTIEASGFPTDENKIAP